MNEISIERVQEILDSIRTKRVLVVGDAMIDRYVWGQVRRISPEAPVPVVEVTKETARLGGAANVANNIVALGASCSIFCVVGDDSDGAELKQLIAENGIDAAMIVTDTSRPTTVKTRVIAHNQQVVRTDRELKDEIKGEIEEALIANVVGEIDRCDAIIISDYGKGVITRNLLEALIPQARSEGKIVSVDPKEAHFMNYKNVTVITPNQFEAASALGRRIQDEDSLKEVGWEIVKKLCPDALLITRGDEGMSLFERDGRYTHFPTVAREVYDVTGAGDTVICSFTLALCGGSTMAEAAQIANHSAGIVIRGVGTLTVKPSELIESFEAYASSPEGS